MCVCGGGDCLCVFMLCVGGGLLAAVKLLRVRLRVRACSSDTTSQWLPVTCIYVCGWGLLYGCQAAAGAFAGARVQ
jgi:hypothetical protein